MMIRIKKPNKYLQNADPRQTVSHENITDTGYAGNDDQQRPQYSNTDDLVMADITRKKKHSGYSKDSSSGASTKIKIRRKKKHGRSKQKAVQLVEEDGTEHEALSDERLQTIDPVPEALIQEHKKSSLSRWSGANQHDEDVPKYEHGHDISKPDKGSIIHVFFPPHLSTVGKAKVLAWHLSWILYLLIFCWMSCSSLCDTIITRKRTGEIYSHPLFPLTRYATLFPTSCRAAIRAGKYEHIRIVIKEIDMHGKSQMEQIPSRVNYAMPMYKAVLNLLESNNHCPQNSIIISDGDSKETTGSYFCGYFSERTDFNVGPTVYDSSGNTITLEFKASHMLSHKGFRITFTAGRHPGKPSCDRYGVDDCAMETADPWKQYFDTNFMYLAHSGPRYFRPHSLLRKLTKWIRRMIYAIGDSANMVILLTIVSTIFWIFVYSLIVYSIIWIFLEIRHLYYCRKEHKLESIYYSNIRENTSMLFAVVFVEMIFISVLEMSTGVIPVRHMSTEFATIYICPAIISCFLAIIGMHIVACEIQLCNEQIQRQPMQEKLQLAKSTKASEPNSPFINEESNSTNATFNDIIVNKSTQPMPNSSPLVQEAPETLPSDISSLEEDHAISDTHNENEIGHETPQLIEDGSMHSLTPIKNESGWILNKKFSIEKSLQPSQEQNGNEISQEQYKMSTSPSPIENNTPVLISDLSATTKHISTSPSTKVIQPEDANQKHAGKKIRSHHKQPGRSKRKPKDSKKSPVSFASQSEGVSKPDAHVRKQRSSRSSRKKTDTQTVEKSDSNSPTGKNRFSIFRGKSKKNKEKSSTVRSNDKSSPLPAPESGETTPDSVKHSVRVKKKTKKKSPK